jgi:hypothetical protein
MHGLKRRGLETERHAPPRQPPTLLPQVGWVTAGCNRHRHTRYVVSVIESDPWKWANIIGLGTRIGTMIPCLDQLNESPADRQSEPNREIPPPDTRGGSLNRYRTPSQIFQERSWSATA